jgi:hypothetical protein
MRANDLGGRPRDRDGAVRDLDKVPDEIPYQPENAMETSNPTPGATTRHPVLRKDSVGARLLLAAAGVTAAAAALSGVLLLFHLASAEPWLQPTPALLNAQARCDRLAERPARVTCIRAVVAQFRASDTAPGRVAEAETAAAEQQHK